MQKRIISSSACKHTVSNKLDIIQEDEIEADEVVGEMLQTTNAKIKIIETPLGLLLVVPPHTLQTRLR